MKQLSIIGLLLAIFAGGAYAHETMFGLTPRTIWTNGFEVEVEQMFEYSYRFFSGDNPDENPRDLRRFEHMVMPGFTWGISRDWSLKAEFPVTYVSEWSKDDRESYYGPGNAEISAKYRFLYHPYPGGSSQAGWFVRAELPTAKKRVDGPSLGDETFTFMGGLTAQTSTTRHYFWIDLAGYGSTRRSDSGEGPGFKTHMAYGHRLWEIKNYRDFDMILLVEMDFEARAQGEMDGDRDENSGFYEVEAAIGFQMNINNDFEVKFGVMLPLYHYHFGKQFVHEGEAMLMFSYVF
ncbi:MAG: hypothetical protein IT462_13400 [Planctomycetes bacterium]|nr:hypothetical protein [Planctomycetota bacterium]